MRKPTPEEKDIIQALFDDSMGGERCWEPDPDCIGVIDHYMSDGPGYNGKLAVIVGGDPAFVSTVTFQPTPELYQGELQ